MYCQNCGSKLKPNIKICTKCGFYNKLNKPNKFNYFKIVLFLIPALAGALYYLFLNNYIKLPRFIESTVQNYNLTSLYKGDDIESGSIKYREEGAKNIEAHVKDPRDGKSYKIVKMPDNNFWFAENLNYQRNLQLNTFSDQVNGKKYYFENQMKEDITFKTFWCNDSLGYGNREWGSGNEEVASKACDKYGALYSWKTANILFENNVNQNSSVCPFGWQIPTVEDWERLEKAIERDLLSQESFKNSSLNMWDFYGFEIIFAGYKRHYKDQPIWYMPTSSNIVGYWTSSSHGYGDGFVIKFGEINGQSYIKNLNLSVSNENKLSGFYVRCFKKFQ